jgi:spore maturation protein CgeB
VLLVGDFTPHRYAASLRDAILRGGGAVIPFDVTAATRSLSWYLRGRVGERLFRQRLWARQLGSQRFNAALIALAEESRPDVVLVVSTYYLTAATIERMHGMGARVGIYFTDNPFPGFSSSRPEQLPLLQAQPVVMVWSDPIAAALRQTGVQSAHFVGFAWDPVSLPHQVARPNGRVSFVGNWEPERETFLNALTDVVPLDIWGGPYWLTRTKRTSPLRRAFRRQMVEGEALARVLSASSVSLNILRRQHRHDGAPTGVIMRTYEIPGAGGTQLATYSPESAAHLQPQTECTYFTDTDSAIAACDRLLTRPAEATAIARDGHAAVLAKHTYDHRVREMIALCLDAAKGIG